MDTSLILVCVRDIAADLAENLAAIERDLAAEGADREPLYARLAAVLDNCLTALTQLNTWGPDNRLPSSEIWNAAGEWLCRGWLQNPGPTIPSTGPPGAGW